MKHAKSPERNMFIDSLRGVSMAAVISLHALANYLGDPFVFRLWDWQQFAVQLFVFCSAYLYFARPAVIDSPTGFVAYVWKRFKRLYLPYLYFLIVYFALVLILRPAAFSFSHVALSALTIGGIDINWLVLLFLQLTLVFPLIQSLRSSRIKLLLYSALAGGAATLLFFYPLNLNYKWIMWLPWSIMGLYAVKFLKYEKDNRKLVFSYLFAAFLFILLMVDQFITKNGLLKIHIHKYPPDILILSYGIAWIGIIHLLYRGGVFGKLKLTALISFLSRNSYTLFFIHYLVIFVMNTAGLQHLLPWFVYWLALFAASMGIQHGLNSLQGKK